LNTKNYGFTFIKFLSKYTVGVLVLAELAAFSGNFVTVFGGPIERNFTSYRALL
jgi:hypothetical protein